VDGSFRFQALAAPFRLFWDGPVNPLAEEIPALRELNQLDLENREGRLALLADPGFRRRFAAMWMTGKRGGIDGWRRRLRLEHMAFDRDFAQMRFHSGCPAPWIGESFRQVIDRFHRWQSDPTVARDTAESAAFARMPADAAGEPGFMLHLFREYDVGLRWWTVSANRDPEIVRELLNDPRILPGFNDSGAHITNMAFYDGNLRCLQIAQQEGPDRVATQVRRLTREPADLLGIDAGRMEVGDVADLTVLDPEALRRYDSEARMRFIWREDYPHEQLVNRSDGVVPMVFIGGRLAWDGRSFAAGLGTRKIGRALRHRDSAHRAADEGAVSESAGRAA